MSMPLAATEALGVALSLALFAAPHPGASGRGKEKPRPGTGGTRLETLELTSQVFGNRRLLRVLLPPGYDAQPQLRYPVLYMIDGQTLFDPEASYTETVWEVDETVATLLEESAIDPLIVVGIDNPGLRERPNELLPWFDAFLTPPLPDPQGGRFPDFLVGEVMPLVEGRYRVRCGAEHTGLGGASYGGLMALYTTLHRPGVFGRLLIESPGLYVNDAAVLREAEDFGAWPGKISLGVGTNEEGRDHCDEGDSSSEAVQDVLRLEDILRRSGLSDDRLLVRVDLCAEHEERVWGQRLPAALRFLFGEAEGGSVVGRFSGRGSAPTH